MLAVFFSLSEYTTIKQQTKRKTASTHETEEGKQRGISGVVSIQFLRTDMEQKKSSYKRLILDFSRDTSQPYTCIHVVHSLKNNQTRVKLTIV